MYGRVKGECRYAQASSSTKEFYCRDRCRKELFASAGSACYEEQGRDHGRSIEMCGQVEGECRDAQASSSTKKCYCRDRCRKELSAAGGYEDQGHGRSTEMCAQAVLPLFLF
ncbi:hypothetical protein FRX31_033833 [Thalictrum thalictroides]|uniref:Uncharacterized protein n=1 Tax=Thalictrum thalictroides TaxID=46969 RepID=A0A7J6UWL3_THATH|nr:hypothetical protein FRX31_033833 [Thalictrum thalictroides]